MKIAISLEYEYTHTEREKLGNWQQRIKWLDLAEIELASVRLVGETKTN